MQKKRPYFRSTTAELKTLYVDNKPDKDVVDAIVHELDHRSRPGAKALAELIREIFPSVPLVDLWRYLLC